MPQQKNYSVKDCDGKNASHPKIPGSGKYFRKLIHILPGQTLQYQINEFKSRNTTWASFDAATKYPMNLVEYRLKRLKLDGQPVEVIPYPGDDTLKLLNEVIVEFDPDFDPNIRSKSQIRKIP